MELQSKDEKGKGLFLRIKYWKYFALVSLIIGGSLDGILLVWMTYGNFNKPDGSDGLFDKLSPMGAVIIVIALLLFVISSALFIYYYVKTAVHLGIKFSFQSNLRGIYKEMERVAKEKKWI